jgi:hypothetical protein
MYRESLSFIRTGCVTLMNPDKRKEKKSNNNRTAKAITIPAIGIASIAALLVLPGLSIVGGSYHSALAQQNMTEGGGGGNATTGGGSQSEVLMHLDEVRKALQNNDIQGAMMHLDLAMNLLRGGSSTQGNTTSTAPLH